MGHVLPASGNRVSDYRRAFLNITQAPRWRGLLIGTFSLLLVIWIWRANSDPYAPGSQLYQKLSGSKNPQDFMWKPPSEFEPSDITLNLEAGNSPIAPGHLKKENSQFHLLIHAPRITSNVCRSLLSSFLLDYPPPTLIGYRQSLDPNSNPAASDFLLENGIPDVTDYLAQQEQIKDEDFVLFVDGENTIFQLPTEALLAKYNAQTEKANEELRTKYHDIPVHNLAKRKLQRFNQSVFFAAEYDIVPIPQRTFLSRFRLGPDTKSEFPVHLNKDLVIGSGSGIRHLFSTAAEQNTRIERSDSVTFNTMYSQQHLLRDSMAEEQRKFQTWLDRNVLPINDKLKKELAEDYAAAKQDMGMDLDFQATMFQIIPAEVHNVAATVIRLNESSEFPVPAVFEDLHAPFTRHESTPHLNSTNAVLAHRTNITLPTSELWTTIPLFTNPKTQQIPSLISLPSSHEPSTDTSSTLLTAPDTNMRELWENLWFYPHARTLLKQYLQKSTSKEIASEAAVGGERWWDVRGGRGGVWTVEGEWLDAAELCAPYGSEIFADGQRGWPSAVADDAELGDEEKGPGGKGKVIGEMVQGGEVVKVVLLPPGDA